MKKNPLDEHRATLSENNYIRIPPVIANHLRLHGQLILQVEGDRLIIRRSEPLPAETPAAPPTSQSVATIPDMPPLPENTGRTPCVLMLAQDFEVVTYMTNHPNRLEVVSWRYRHQLIIPNTVSHRTVYNAKDGEDYRNGIRAAAKAPIQYREADAGGYLLAYCTREGIRTSLRWVQLRDTTQNLMWGRHEVGCIDFRRECFFMKGDNGLQEVWSSPTGSADWSGARRHFLSHFSEILRLDPSPSLLDGEMK